MDFSNPEGLEVCEYYASSDIPGECWKQKLCKKFHPIPITTPVLAEVEREAEPIPIALPTATILQNTDEGDLDEKPGTSTDSIAFADRSTVLVSILGDQEGSDSVNEPAGAEVIDDAGGIPANKESSDTEYLDVDYKPANKKSLDTEYLDVDNEPARITHARHLEETNAVRDKEKSSDSEYLDVDYEPVLNLPRRTRITRARHLEEANAVRAKEKSSDSEYLDVDYEPVPNLRTETKTNAPKLEDVKSKKKKHKHTRAKARSHKVVKKPKMIDALNEKKVPLPATIKGFLAQVSYTNYVNVRDFYVIPLRFDHDGQEGKPESNIRKLTAMEHELKSFLKSLERKELEDLIFHALVPGDLVAVRDPIHFSSKYKRGVVLEFPNNHQVKIQLLDVGSTIIASRFSVAKLPKQFAEMPPMAYRCRLKLLSGLMNLETSDLFQRFQDKVFYVHVCPGLQPKFGNGSGPQGFGERIPYQLELWTPRIMTVDTNPLFFMVTLILLQATRRLPKAIAHSAKITDLKISSNIFLAHSSLAQ